MCRVQTYTGWHTAFRRGHVIIEWMSLLNYNITPALDLAVLHVPVVDTFRRVQNMMTGRIYGRPFCQQIIRITNETGKKKWFYQPPKPPARTRFLPQEPPRPADNDDTVYNPFRISSHNISVYKRIAEGMRNRYSAQFRILIGKVDIIHIIIVMSYRV